MSLPVQAAAEALGVWRERHQSVDRSTPNSGPDLVVRRDGDAFTVQPRDFGAPVPVDDHTAALILLGYARGLRVDLGECPACRARGSKRGLARWEQYAGWESSLSAAGMWRERRRRTGWKAEVVTPHAGRPSEGPNGLFQHLKRSDRTGPYGTLFRWHYLIAWRPCPACIVDGEPIGRQAIPWERALLDARTRTAEERTHDFIAALDRDDDSTDAATREADTATREALAVLGDSLNSTGDQLGLMLTAWLDGECRECEGAGQLPVEVRVDRPLSVRDLRICPACDGHGAKVRAFDDLIESGLRAIVTERAA